MNKTFRRPQTATYERVSHVIAMACDIETTRMKEERARKRKQQEKRHVMSLQELKDRMVLDGHLRPE